MEPNFSPQDANFLDKYFGNWLTLRDAGYIRHLDPFVKGEYAEIYRRSLDPRAIFCLTCPDDVIHLIRVLYTNYEKWKAAQVTPAPPIDPPAPDPVDVFPDSLDYIGQDHIEMGPADQPDPGDQVPVQEPKRGRGRPKK